MRELRRREAERLIQQDLPRRIRDVILAADHVRDLHQRIVDDDGEVVGGAAVGADDHRIADDVGVERRPRRARGPVNVTSSVSGTSKADDRPLAGVDPRARLFARDRGTCRDTSAAGRRRDRPGDRPRACPASRSSSTRDASRSARWRRTRRGAAARTGDRGRAAADVGPSSQSSPSQRRSSRMLASDSRVERSASVSSMRRMNVPSLPCASSQLKSAVRALPTCSWPVGLGGDAHSESTRAVSSFVQSSGRHGHSATACAAMASPRPTASTPSFVFPLTLTRLDVDAERAGERSLDRVDAAPIFGRSRMTTTSTFTTRKPRSRTSATRAQQVDARRALPARIGVRKVRPMSPARGAEDRVGDRVADHVGIGMPERARARTAPSRRRGRAAALDEAVQVVAHADAASRFATRAPRRRSDRRRRDLDVARIAPRRRARGGRRARPAAPRRWRRRPAGRARSRRAARRGGTPAASAPGRSSSRGSVSTITRRRPVCDALHGVADRQRHDRGAVRGGGVDRARDHRRRHERPRRVVDEHDVAPRCARHRTHWPPNPAGARRRRRRGPGIPRSQAGGGRQHPGGHRDDDPGDARMRANASTLRSRIGRPPRSSNCFGTPAPSRRPAPPAAMMAVTCMEAFSAGTNDDYTAATGQARLRFGTGSSTSCRDDPAHASTNSPICGRVARHVGIGS